MSTISVELREVLAIPRVNNSEISVEHITFAVQKKKSSYSVCGKRQNYGTDWRQRLSNYEERPGEHTDNLPLRKAKLGLLPSSAELPGAALLLRHTRLTSRSCQHRKYNCGMCHVDAWVCRSTCHIVAMTLLQQPNSLRSAFVDTQASERFRRNAVNGEGGLLC